MDFPPWADLPEPILTHVMSFLPLSERSPISAVCESWKRCLDSPFLWRVFNCGFFLPVHAELLELIKNHGGYIKHLTMNLNQSSSSNRECAISAIDFLANSGNIHLTHFKLCFKGQNPYFYSGQEFILALSTLFNKIGSSKNNSRFEYLNLSELHAGFDNDFIENISFNCGNLQYFNILNGMLICNVTPPCIKTLAERCHNLQVLHIYHTSLSDDVLDALSQPQRTPLRRLGIVCRREEKYGQDLSSEAWSKLVQFNPDLKVELGFDNTCPYYRVAEIMKPEIPVVDLHLTTFTIIYPEINIASSYYESTLEKLVVQTRPSRELDEALLNLANRCHKLHSLLVYCILDKRIIEQILDLHPEMKRSGSYILKSEVESEPWTVGKEDEEGD